MKKILFIALKYKVHSTKIILDYIISNNFKKMTFIFLSHLIIY